ncbi:hypothetical protein WMY93_003327 [Mugilogobius chulae]|uniref:Uncharacterized protein n=1 Tax=Mugilogobius chulae TaxID=88201 RepID=A0AAW0PW99_9GOBI
MVALSLWVLFFHLLRECFRGNRSDDSVQQSCRPPFRNKNIPGSDCTDSCSSPVLRRTAHTFILVLLTAAPCFLSPADSGHTSTAGHFSSSTQDSVCCTSKLREIPPLSELSPGLQFSVCGQV